MRSDVKKYLWSLNVADEKLGIRFVNIQRRETRKGEEEHDSRKEGKEIRDNECGRDTELTYL